MGPPDRESWVLRDLYPTGGARGWRRTGCIALLAGALLLVLVAIVLAVVVG